MTPDAATTPTPAPAEAEPAALRGTPRRPWRPGLPARILGPLRRPATLARAVGAWLASGPVCLALVAVTWAVGLTLGAVPRGPSTEVAATWATSLYSFSHGHWWALLTAMVVPGNIASLLGVSLLALTAGIAAERRLGHARTAGLLVTCQVIGALVTVGVAALLAGAQWEWGGELFLRSSHGPSPALVGLLMAATARVTTLWRRRWRVLLGVSLLVLVAFSGLYHDVARAAAGLVGLQAGRLLWGRHSPQRSLVGTRREGRVLVALAVVAVVLGTILSTYSPHAVGPLSSLRVQATGVPFDATRLATICADPALEHECRRATLAARSTGVAPNLLLLMPMIVQIVLAAGLALGRRTALVGTLALQGMLLAVGAVQLGVVLAAAPGVGEAARAALGISHRGWPEAALVAPVVVPLALIALVLASRRLFAVRAPRGVHRRLGGRLALLTLLTLAVTVVLGLVLRDQFEPTATVPRLLADQVVRLVPSATLSLLSPVLLPRDGAASWLVEWAPVVLWLALAAGLARGFASQEAAEGEDGATRVRALLRDPGGSTLGWWATWRGNSWWFSPTHDAAVAYRAIGGVALTPCAPVCRPQDVEDVVAQFAEFCVERGIIPALYSVHAPVAAHTRALGWTCIQVAEETVLDLPGLAFTGKRFQDVRTAINRAAKEGVTTEWHTYATLPVGLRDQIHTISEEWVSQKGLPEMGFTLGGVAELADPDVRLLLAVDAERTVHGVTSWMPVHRDGALVGLTLDFMRRRTDGFRPVVELLIAQAALSAQADGLEVLSLSGAPLARSGREAGASGASGDAGAGASGDGLPGSGALDDVLDRLGAVLEPVYGFRSLLQFKSKFQPRREPVFLTVPDVADLPVVAAAIGRAYLPSMSVGQGIRLGSTLLRR